MGECHAVRHYAVINCGLQTWTGRGVTLADDPVLIQSPMAAILAAYETHARSAYSVAWRVTRDHDLAAEAVQEAFLCLWRNKAVYTAKRGDVGPFLHTIVHRRAIDLVRNHVRNPRPLGLHLVADQLESVDVTPEDHACRADDFGRARNAVMALPDEQRVPLVLAYYYGLTRSEIAVRLDLPLGTVKSRIMAAKRDLRTVLLAGMRSPSG